MLTKNQTKLNRFSRTVVKDKLNCDLAPCLNYGTCTLSPFNSLGFFCICPPGYYGDFCQHRTIERFTTISFIGILVILILILALCIAVCCLCHRERKHHRVIKQIRSSEVCSNLLSKAYASKSPCSPCPYTEEYQEKREKKDCKHQVEPANVECHHGAKRNDHCPELTGSQQKKTKLAEQGRRKCPSNAISRAPCPDNRQNSSVEIQESKTTMSKHDGHSLMDKNNLPCQINCSDDKLNSPAESSHSRTTLSKICRSISSLIGNGSPPRQSDVPDDRLNSPVESCHSRTTLSKKDGSLIDKGSPPRQSDVPDDRLNSPVGSSHSRTTLSKKDTSKSSLIDKGSPPRQSDFPDQRSSQQNLTAVSKQSRHISSGMDSSNAACQSDIAAFELNCPESCAAGTSEDSQSSTSTSESCDQMLVDKCNAECQSNYPASRVPSEDCKSNSAASFLNKVENTSSNFQTIQSKNQAQIMPCNDLSDSISSSQSSYQDYLSSLPTDISTPRSESSSQISSSSEMADDFGNNSVCSLNSSMPSEALVNLMQSYFTNSDDVKSVKISILLDKSQTDDLSHSSNVKESTSGSSYQKKQKTSPSVPERRSRIGLKNKCGFPHCKELPKNNSVDVEPSLTSVENPARNCSRHVSQEVVHFDPQIPSLIGGSSDWYCVEDKEPCSKTTTVRYVFTDSETDV